MTKMATIRPIALIVTFALINYCQSFLLLPGFFPGSQNLVSVHRRQSEQIPRHLPEVSEPVPSCAELRAMWRHMNRMARHSELTNEIPQFPNTLDQIMPMREYPDYIEYPIGKIRTRPEGRRQPTRSTKTRIGLYSGQVYPGSRMNIPGRFGGPALPEDMLGNYGTIVNSPAEKQRVKNEQLFNRLELQVGSSLPEIGTFKLFPDEGDNAYRNKYKYGNVRNMDSTRDPSVVIIPALADVEGEPFTYQTKSIARQKASCKRFEGKVCKRREDCHCSRNQLQCVEGTCLRSPKPSKESLQNPQNLTNLLQSNCSFGMSYIQFSSN
ncbi:uncharacterized protein LOC111612971 isoform X1 [Centruroides sculpturatus]|uniref:uncharacterized protein LOC111612971 isoform X1 n=1 Tax=Centruroides sculpturatus TaxID=218467 RepID=UPI000C6CCCD4|nr:uncharacterized protein LOC111612971 isoform X1 [Centruroides sculpturatus]